ncbi:MAG: DUF927 domain-containing protein [Syntrophus sp. (in: bacteria)]
MEENLEVMVKEAILDQVEEGEGQAEEDQPDEENAASAVGEEDSYKVVGCKLFKVLGEELVLIANFHLKIISRSVLIDEDVVTDQLLDLEIHFKEDIKAVRVTAKEFQSGNFMTKIWSEVGPGAILYGKKKDLVIATQELSGNEVPVRQVLTSNGFTADGFYLSPGMKVTPEGILPLDNIEVDLSGGNFSRRIGFSHADVNDVKDMANHLFADFLNLKGHEVTFPLIGHMCLAPFASLICGDMGRKKPAMHLEGPSGGGKTMLASLAMSFFGDFQDHFTAWTSTANAIEREGYYFRDSLFLIDDLKASLIAPETVVRTLQNYVDGHGRARMKSNADLQKQFYIRGLLLSTGEDFVDNIESINGRTIVINVEPEKNTEAGRRCLENRHFYRSFMPGLIQSVISDPAWKTNSQALINAMIMEFHALTMDLPNGLRISSNWALNSLGFCLFVDFIRKIGIIDNFKTTALLTEYAEIAIRHIQHQKEGLTDDDPVSMMFRILQQKLQAGQVSVLNLKGTPSGRGRVVGTAQEEQKVVHLHPDLVMEVLKGHFHKIPFSKKALTNALARQGFITRSENGRWTRQVRDRIAELTRSNVWEIELSRFNENCGIHGS